MKNKIVMFLAAVLLITFSMATISEAKIMSNTLSSKQKSIVPIAAFTAIGDMDNLKISLHEGLDGDLTVNEIKEVLVQMYAYCGFPRSLNAVNNFMVVVEERKAKDIKDEIGAEAKSMPTNIDKNQYGMLVRQKLFGRTSEAPPSGYQLFTPVLDDFLKEHLFADIFYRDNLDHLSREIATVSALAGMTGANSQLQAHMGAAMITGLSEGEMKDLINVIKTKVGSVHGDNAENVFEQLIKK